MFTPFVQGSDDKSGFGLGLSIAHRNVEADGGSLTLARPARQRMQIHDRGGISRMDVTALGQTHQEGHLA